MALYLAREEHGSGRAFKRIAFALDDGELVIEPGSGDALRLSVRIGDEHEEHELAFHAEALRGIASRSKLIQIEEVGHAELPSAAKTVVRSQSKLIKIEDTRGRQLAAATLVLP